MKRRLTCDCGSRYDYAPEEDGTTVDCQCGRTITFPAAPPAPAAPAPAPTSPTIQCRGCLKAMTEPSQMHQHADGKYCSSCHSRLSAIAAAGESLPPPRVRAPAPPRPFAAMALCAIVLRVFGILAGLVGLLVLLPATAATGEIDRQISVILAGAGLLCMGALLFGFGELLTAVREIILRLPAPPPAPIAKG